MRWWGTTGGLTRPVGFCSIERGVEVDEFTRGALIAAGLVARLHGSGPAASILNEMGLWDADVSDLDGFDRDNLAIAQGELYGKINLRGLRGVVGISSEIATDVDCAWAA